MVAIPLVRGFWGQPFRISSGSPQLLDIPIKPLFIIRLICVNLRHLRFQGFNDRIRVRTRFSDALLLTLVFGLLPAMLWAEHSIAEDRVLRVQDGPAARQYPVTELIDAIGLDELRVAADAHFGQGRVFAGFALRTLLSHVGLGDAQELLLGGCPRIGVATGTAILFVEDVEEPDCLA